MSAGLAALVLAAALPAQSPLFAEQLVARWTVDSPGAGALVGFARGDREVYVVEGRRLAIHEAATGAVTKILQLPCAARALDEGHLLCARALYKVQSGALLELAKYDEEATALAVRAGVVAVARKSGVHLTVGVDERRLPVAEGKRVEALAFGPEGARLYAIAAGTIYVGIIDERVDPQAPETRRLVLDLTGARAGRHDGPFRARFGGVTLSERDGVPRLSLAAASVIVDLRTKMRVSSVAARGPTLLVADGDKLRLYSRAAFGEEPPPPPPPAPAPIDLPSAVMITTAVLVFAGTPVAAGLTAGTGVLASIAVAGVAVLGTAAAVYGAVGLIAGGILLYEAARPWTPIQNDPTGGLINVCGEACWEVAQLFFCLTGAAFVLGGAALLGGAPFLYALFDPAAGLGDPAFDATIFAAAGVGAGAGLATWLLGYLPLEDDEELVETREIPREVMAVAVGALAATATWGLMRTANPR